MAIEEIQKCKWCQADIKWLRTKNGKLMPVNHETYTGETMYEPAIHMTHFATCPHAKEIKEAQKKKKEGENKQ